MRPLSRRTLLRGTGAALALPWLDAMLPRLASAPRAEDRAPSLVFLYVPNGVHMSDWTPASTGREFALPWILEPLATHHGRISILSGLTHDKAEANGDGPGDHARAAAAFLTGCQPVKSRIHAGVSLDQLLASRTGHATRQPSLVLGVERGAQSGNCDSGYPCSYSSNLSWTSPTAPALKETHPQRVFDRLTRDPWTSGEEFERARRKSVLDLAREDAARLARDLGAADRRRLEEYLESVRALELRLARADESGATENAQGERPADDPGAYEEHVALMLDVVAFALRADLTRLVTFMFANEGSNRAYPHLDVREGHHSLSHHGGDAAKHEALRRIHRWQVERLAAFVGALSAGDEAPLARTTVLFGSGISDGDKHNHDELPVLVCGRGADGRHERVTPRTPLCDLFVTLARRHGVPLESFGDSRGDLDASLVA